MKWRSVIITCLICLLPIIAGAFLWDRLPDKMAIHFNFNFEPDNFASKGFAVFGIPIILAALQMISCIIKEKSVLEHRKGIKAERVSIWIIPAITIIVQGIIIVYGMKSGVK